MHRYALLVLVMPLLAGCAWKPPPKPLPPGMVCPAWLDAAKGRKAKLADELESAPEGAVWPDVLVEDQALKDQLLAAGCKPTEGKK